MAWGDFLRQHEAQGRDKGDGYAPTDFAGMSPEERARAQSMMLARALDGDDIDLSGLRYIGDAATVAALDAGKDSRPAQQWDYDISRLDVLYSLTGDEVYLAALSRYLDSKDSQAQVRAAYVLAFHLLPPDAEPFLVDRISDGRHEAAFDGLLRAWIGLHEGAVCDVMGFQRHIDLVRRVYNAPPRQRRALLAEAAPGLAAPAG